MLNKQPIQIITDKLIEIKDNNCFPDHILAVHQFYTHCKSVTPNIINKILLDLELDGTITSLVKEGFEEDTTILKFRIN